MNTKAKEVLRMIGDWVTINSLLFLIWVFISWLDVISHNLTPDPVYQWWNLFQILF